VRAATAFTRDAVVTDHLWLTANSYYRILDRVGGIINMLRTLGIETSCDESAVAILDGDGRVEVNLLSSQVAAHSPYGGVVPELASREHLKALPYLVERALEAERRPIEMVAVTAGPGWLEPSWLEFGLRPRLPGGEAFHWSPSTTSRVIWCHHCSTSMVSRRRPSPNGCWRWSLRVGTRVGT
jgi:hypothetical protein